MYFTDFVFVLVVFSAPHYRSVLLAILCRVEHWAVLKIEQLVWTSVRKDWDKRCEHELQVFIKSGLLPCSYRTGSCTASASISVLRASACVCRGVLEVRQRALIIAFVHMLMCGCLGAWIGEEAVLGFSEKFRCVSMCERIKQGWNTWMKRDDPGFNMI